MLRDEGIALFSMYTLTDNMVLNSLLISAIAAHFFNDVMFEALRTKKSRIQKRVLRICLLFLEMEVGREREGENGGGIERERKREREKHGSVASHMHPEPGIEPTTFWCIG